MPHLHTVHIYYEDTDVSGLVYHANYLKYFERAREHMLGRAELVRLLDGLGVGFVVYKCSLVFKEGARLGDEIQIRSTVKLDSEYRAIFQQDVWRPGGTKPMVQGEVHLVAIDAEGKLVRLPEVVLSGVAERYG